MELEQLVKLAKNLHDHFYLKRKTILTNDEYRVCNSLLSGNINLSTLFRGLHIIKRDAEIFGSLNISRGSKNG